MSMSYLLSEATYPDDTPQLEMVWPQQLLNQPPEPTLPDGYHLRTYRPGDEARFYEVMASAGWPGWDDERLEPWKARILPASWFFAVHTTSDSIVASSMAIHSHTPDHPFGGEVGWVASDAAHRSQGLGRAVVAAVVARFLQIGYRNIHLYTEDFRLPAIKIYLKLGFVPYLYTEAMPVRWQSVCAALDWPYTPDQWRTQ